MRYARIVDGVVFEVVEVAPEYSVADLFHPDIVASMDEVGPEVQQGYIFNEGRFEPPAPESGVSLETLKSSLKVSIDQAAETERLKYITPGNGQAMTYQQKVDEARAFKAATNPKSTDYPLLSSEVGITAGTIDEVADVILLAFTEWQQIGGAIERTRLSAKRDIDSAKDEAAARQIVDAAVWPSAS